MKKAILVGVVVLLVGIAVAAYFLVYRPLVADPVAPLFASECAGCHGNDMGGSARGPALLNSVRVLGKGVGDIEQKIARHPRSSGYEPDLDGAQLRGLAVLIGETMTDRTYRTFEVDDPLEIPAATVQTDHHAFRVEVVTDDLHPLPFSLAPLPEGGFLVSEKMKGLRHVSADGQVSELIEGTPTVYDDGFEVFLPIGVGWLLDVALHPNYVENGWVYLHYTERCTDCEATTPVSRNTVIRGRVVDGVWVDQELIWQPGREFYSRNPDIGAGGRLAFDDSGHLFISVGLKGSMNYDGMQDLSTPTGKVHRVTLEGEVPLTNPFLSAPGAMRSVWTYGHRSPQGLEFNPLTRELWETEMGPRGGDEINLLVPGKNYGWPLTSLGLDYDGTHVDYGQELNLEFDLAEIEQPRIDLTPGPAVSSFAIYTGAAFEQWHGQFIVGSLAARELYRVDVRGDGEVEKLLTNIGRIRDVEVGPDGLVYLLLEHPDGGHIVRLVPDDAI